MATVSVNGAATAAIANLCTAQTGNGATTNIVDRGGNVGPALLRIVTTVGATPTCTYLVEGSADGTNWQPAVIADSTTPATNSFATFAITTATTTTKYIQANQPFRYLRMTMSANTNVTTTADVVAF